MARRHKGVAFRVPRRPLTIETLEGRRVLNASSGIPQAAMVHEAPAVPFAAAATQSVTDVKTVTIVPTLHYGPAVLIAADEVPSGLSPAESGGTAAGRPLNQLGLGNDLRPSNDLGMLARANLPPPLRSLTLVVSPAQVPSLDAAAVMPRTTSLTPPDPGAVGRSGSMPLIVVLADGRGVDPSSVRMMVWMWQTIPSDVMQGLFQGYNQFDSRGRFAELAHDALSAGHPEGSHSAGDSTSSDEAMLEGRHAMNAALFSQSAENDSMLAGAGRVTREIQPALLGVESTDGAGRTAGHEPVGSLVALSDDTAAWAAAVWAAGSQVIGGGDGNMLDSALHDLLAPRFAFDAAVLGDAIRELVSEVDELGENLLGFLAETAHQAETALVAGVAAGLAYHHWRRRERREQAESRAMLAARFVTGPASVRLVKGDSR